MYVETYSRKAAVVSWLFLLVAAPVGQIVMFYTLKPSSINALSHTKITIKIGLVVSEN